MSKQLTIISLGAGVQSTTMALMAAHGEIGPMPDCAIFADVGAEPRAVYDHLDWLEAQLPFPVHRVSAGNLRQDLMKRRSTREYALMPIPAYVAGGRGGSVNRSCTRDYKIRPIMRQLRALLDLTGKRAPKHVIVEQWIGISTDETIRMKPSRDGWIEHRWPLIEKRMSRGDCVEWFKRHYPGRTLVKSACTFCPYHSNEAWRALAPDEFADAVVVDRMIRDARAGQRSQQGKVFLHPSLKPLNEVDLSTAEERGQLNLFLNECEGMCGV
ncbi:MAG: hypothetical protein E5W43_00795 [Mesorhizobium sp.]|nr:MAG: hypothetical protein E5W43_00795 [Mesorhizobium sp.]